VRRHCILVGAVSSLEVLSLYDDWVTSSTKSADLPLDVVQLKPGLRLAVGLSGGADSVALTRALAARAGELGLVLHAAHLHHGLRGEEGDADQQFSSEFAETLGLPFHTHRVDTLAEASGKKESVEEAARRLRYGWFRELMAGGHVDAVATAHTLDDQAETVLGKFLRGAWTEGLSGVHPIVTYPEGRILRPLLGATRLQIKAYLKALGQGWREDSSNQDPAYTRNRLRAQLLPELEVWNPKIRQHLAQMAELARGEEAYWDTEIGRLAPQLILTGRPVRGGGRASGDEGVLALDVVRLQGLNPAVQRRLLRHAADLLGVSLSFDATESLRELVLQGRSGQQMSLPGPIAAERTARELRLSRHVLKGRVTSDVEEVELPIPGEAVAFGWRFVAKATGPAAPATIRNWRPGDRVTLRYSSGPRKIKEVLERLKVSGTDRLQWPVIEWQGKILWMQGAELQPIHEIAVVAEREPA
jgi:tRNA(Ile)-lysidine synthase